MQGRKIVDLLWTFSSQWPFKEAYEVGAPICKLKMSNSFKIKISKPKFTPQNLEKLHLKQKIQIQAIKIYGDFMKKNWNKILCDT